LISFWVSWGLLFLSTAMYWTWDLHGEIDRICFRYTKVRYTALVFWGARERYIPPDHLAISPMVAIIDIMRLAN
jgi:hypothetical protein